MQPAQRAFAMLAGFLTTGPAAAGGPFAIDANGEPLI